MYLRVMNSSCLDGWLIFDFDAIPGTAQDLVVALGSEINSNRTGLRELYLVLGTMNKIGCVQDKCLHRCILSLAPRF